jgi:hypothetical protein
VFSPSEPQVPLGLHPADYSNHEKKTIFKTATTVNATKTPQTGVNKIPRLSTKSERK